MLKVPPSLYEGREQAYVKHLLLEKYLVDWAYKVGSKWDSLVYVDAFSGPWGTKDEQQRDSSFSIAGTKLKEALQGLSKRCPKLKVRCILIEQDEHQFPKLEKFATEATSGNFEAIPLNGDFVELIPKVQKLVKETSSNPFAFYFLDPKGWKAIPMDKLKPLLLMRSCEVLINIMTKDIIRFLEMPDREASYHRLFGRKDALVRIQTHPPEERTEATVREYCRSLKDLCEFEYVSEAVIMEPDQEKVRYFLIFATHYYLGVQVFKEAEMTAAKIQNYMRQRSLVSKRGSDPDTLILASRPSQKVQELAGQYLQMAKRKVAAVLLNRPGQPVLYQDLYCKAMAFPFVTPDDLNHWLCNHLKTVVAVKRDGETVLKPLTRRLDTEKQDFVTLIDPEALKLDLRPAPRVQQKELFEL